ncbi:MAG: hypothetical protein HQ490_06940 [Lutibacter sp.]|nr:hypothetical protein [Lutibacter sp.]
MEDFYTLINKSYPLTKQHDLLTTQNELDVAVIKTKKLPQLHFSAQATYQSDVTSIPIVIPGSTIEPPNKDQYKATASINQLIYDGGFIDASIEGKSALLKA